MPILGKFQQLARLKLKHTLNQNNQNKNVISNFQIKYLRHHLQKIFHRIYENITFPHAKKTHRIEGNVREIKKNDQIEFVISHVSDRVIGQEKELKRMVTTLLISLQAVDGTYLS